jgi:hypothetical protein
VGEQRLSRESGAQQRRSRGEQQDAPAAKGQPDEERQAKQDAESPIASHALQQRVQVVGGALS